MAALRQLAIPDNVVYEVLDDEAVILNLESGVYFTLDPVATRIWSLIAERADRAAIRRAMLEEFDVDGAVLDADLDRVLSQLSDRGLIVSLHGDAR
jgi:PqqD family protein of HPr-rel-A system